MDKHLMQTTSRTLLDLLFKEVVVQDEYLLTSINRPVDYFIDIGANIGVTSLHALEVLDIRKAVIALEPQADNFKCLKANLSNVPEAKCGVYILNKALGEQPMSLTTAPKNKGMFRALPLGTTGGASVTALLFSDIIREFNISYKDVVILKCDCEGGEQYLMSALETFFMGSCYQICLEVHYGEEYFPDCPTKDEYKKWLSTFHGFEKLKDDWRSNKNGHIVMRSVYAG